MKENKLEGIKETTEAIRRLAKELNVAKQRLKELLEERFDLYPDSPRGPKD